MKTRLLNISASVCEKYIIRNVVLHSRLRCLRDCTTLTAVVGDYISICVMWNFLTLATQMQMVSSRHLVLAA